MKKFLKYQWVLWLHVVLMVIAYVMAPFLDDKHYWIWFKITAVAWAIVPVFLLYCFYQTRAVDVLIVWSFFALNNVFDELFFNPKKFELNEIVFAGITIIYILKCKLIGKKPLSK